MPLSLFRESIINRYMPFWLYSSFEQCANGSHASVAHCLFFSQNKQNISFSPSTVIILYLLSLYHLFATCLLLFKVLGCTSTFTYRHISIGGSYSGWWMSLLGSIGKYGFIICKYETFGY